MTGMAAGALALPPGTRLVPFWNGAITPIPSADKRQLADAALGAARSRAPPTPTCASAATSTSSSSPARTRSRTSPTPSRTASASGSSPTAPGASPPPATSRRTAWRRAAAAGGGDRQGQRQAADGAGAAGAAEGLGEVTLADADREERLRGADQGEGRPAAGGQRRGDEGRRQASSTRSCSWSTSRSTSPPPTAPTSTRTCTASGPTSRSPPSTQSHRQVPTRERFSLGPDGHGLGVPRAARRTTR